MSVTPATEHDGRDDQRSEEVDRPALRNSGCPKRVGPMNQAKVVRLLHELDDLLVANCIHADVTVHGDVAVRDIT